MLPLPSQPLLPLPPLPPLPPPLPPPPPPGDATGGKDNGDGKDDGGDNDNGNGGTNHHKDLPHDLIAQIMKFRTAYLRAVAKATVDEGFRKELTDRNKDPLVILKREFDYDCPWGLKLLIVDDPIRGPRVNVANGTVMTRPYIGETITIYIPDKCKVSDKQEMDALAAYYDDNLWFLRPRGPKSLGWVPGDVRQQGKDAWSSMELVSTTNEPSRGGVRNDWGLPLHKSWSSVNMLASQGLRFNLGASLDHFLSFAAAMFNAVALAWHDDNFRALLTNERPDPRQTILLLEQWLGYKYPWELDLIVKIDDTSSWHKTDVKCDDGNTRPVWKWKIKDPQLELTLPWMSGAGGSPPKVDYQTPNYQTDPQFLQFVNECRSTEVKRNGADRRVTVMGLALYNTDGPGWPFTCG